MINYSNNTEFLSSEYPSQIRFSFPFKNPKQNNISFKNSVNMINSEKKSNNHRQYLIGFIRNNNNKNRKSPSPHQIISKDNSSNILSSPEKGGEKIIDKKSFFNDYFNQQLKFEKNNYNKNNPDELLIDINEYIGEDSKRPINLEIMDINMHNFIPGRISSKSFGLINSYAANTNQGIDRNYNDDRVKIIINMNRPSNYIKKASWPLISFFAIFDGHNGDHCAEYLRQNLLQYIYTNPNFPKNVEKSIKEAFIKADEDYLKNHSIIKDKKLLKTNINPNNNLDFYNNSGSCGLILLIVDTKIYIANVGDSRCIMSSHNGKIQKDVTRDHKPEFPYEKQRIYDNGGNIYRNETIFNEDFENKSHKKILLGPYRVNPGKLSVSRTIGDAKAKLEKLGGLQNVIIPEPDIYVFDYYKDNIDYFILGCDGIFDRLKSYEVIQCVNTILNKNKELLKKGDKFNYCFNSSYDKRINMSTTCGNIVDMVLRASMIRKSYDNVTCIMVAFKDLLIENNNIENNQDSNENEQLVLNRKEKNLKNNNSNYAFINGHKNKEINIINQDKINEKNFDNRYENDEDFNQINIYNNTYNNNFVFIDNKVKNYEIKNKSENRNRNEIKNHRRIASQSQEKKIRELISLFSINNKKGINNDNSNILYRSYGSKNDIIIEQKKDNNNQIDKRNKILFNINNLEKNSSTNITLYQNNKERFSNTNKNIEINTDEKNPTKKKEIKFFKKINLELRNSGNHFSNIKKYNSITKEDNNNNSINNNPINSEIIEKRNISNRSKINTTNIFETPKKHEIFSKRITTRKIIRKTNNIFNLKNNAKEKEKIENNNNHNMTMNNNKNNFFHSINSSNKGNYETVKDNDNSNTIKKLNINIKKNNFNYEKYKNRNLKYQPTINHSEIYHTNSEEKDDKFNYKDILNKSRKYQKNKRIQGNNLPLSSSVGLIYTKKNKIK